LPSSDAASLSVTNGIVVVVHLANGSISASASTAQGPVVTSMPASRSIAKPRPSTSGQGSTMAATTRRTFAAIRSSAQDAGFEVAMLQGSRVT
jgi:hypothetical protein